MKERLIYADSSEAIKRLTRNGIRVDPSDKMILVPHGKAVGIKLWGAIDYLLNHCGWRGWGMAR